MNSQPLSKSDLVKRINYHNTFQEIANTLPSLIMERAKDLSEAEVKTIKELNGNVLIMAVAITRCIQSLYKALPDYSEMRNLNPSSYSTFLYNALQGLMTVDERLLKPPLIRLFGEDILINDVINEKHTLFPYIKVCGSAFLAECKKPITAHWEGAIRNGFLSLMPFKSKNVSFDLHQLIFLPILKTPGTPPLSKDKWQLYYLAAKHYCVPVACTAQKSEDRYKIFYEDANCLISSAKSAVTQLKSDLKYRPIKQNVSSTSSTCHIDDITTNFVAKLGFKKVEIKGVNDAGVSSAYACLEEITSKLGKLGALVNNNTSVVISNLRKDSMYERANNALVITDNPHYHECKIGYIYGQAMDRLIASKLFKKGNYLGSDYWFLVEDENATHIERSLMQMYNSITFQHSPKFVYSASLLDGLYGKFFFLHPGEMFARAIAKLVSMDNELPGLSLPETGSAALLYPNADEINLLQMAVGNVESSMPTATQEKLDL